VINVPPFVETYVSVIVHIDVVEKAVEPAAGHCQAGALEGHAELLLANLAVAVLVDGSE
jgi:hypothetical protein